MTYQPGVSAIAQGRELPAAWNFMCRPVPPTARVWRRVNHDGILSGLIQGEIICRVLRSAGGVRLRASATPGEQSNRTAKTIAWVRAYHVKALRVEDLAEIAGMGMSTLHRYFRALTAMSPLQHQ